ncbi:MAG: hypothetical protein EZS28_036065, partial [Streblomastix strix]
KERIRLQEEAKEKERIRLQEEEKEKERIRLQEEAKEKERIRLEEEERIRKVEERMKNFQEYITSNYQGIIPIGWSDDLLEEDEQYYFIRVEIIVDYPANLDITALTVVDPNNPEQPDPNQPGFHFVDFEVDKQNISDSINQISSSSQSKTDNEMRTAIAVPAFCVQVGEKNCFYSLHHSTLGWKHGVKPRLHKIEDYDENDGMITYRVKLTTEIGILRGDEYIQHKLRNNLQVPFFAALESVIPNVPESALRGAFDLIQRSNNDELLKFALAYKDSAVAQYSLDILTSRKVSLFTIASKFKDLNIVSDDPRLSTAITSLIHIKNLQQHQKDKEQTNEQKKFKQPQVNERYSNGFLCDRKSIFVDQVVPDRLLLETAQQLNNTREGNNNLEYANELLRIGHISERIPRFITTLSAKQRLDIVSYALRSGVPLLIQGPTSASKSLTAQVASVGLYGQFPLIYALSEQTEVGDLLGRKMLRRRGTSMLSYVPGVLAEAYEKGRVLLLDEFDLCPPKVLSSILSALDGSTIEVDGRQIVRHQNFRVIATLNGETEGFTSQQRNILTSEVLARFRTISFPLMSREECNEIFSQLLQKSYSQYEQQSKQISDIHKSVEKYYVSDQRTDKSRGYAAMTLRNFSYALDLMVLDKLQPRDACTISYLAQIPTADRAQFNKQIDVLGSSDNFQKLRDEIIKTAKEIYIHPHPQFIDAAVYAINAARAGLHVLLEGPSGSGLTTLARFVAKFCTNKTTQNIPNEIPIVLLGPESTVENIIGSFKPQEVSGEETDLTKLIKWENGPLLIASQAGIPVILDRID